MNGLLIVIPALKKSVAFPDDLVKKLAGVTLIQRAITLAKSIVPDNQIMVMTDSEEINLICMRQGVVSYFDKELCWLAQTVSALEIVPYLNSCSIWWHDLMLLSPYAPLLRVATLRAAFERYCDAGAKLLLPVICSPTNPYRQSPLSLKERLKKRDELLTVESSSFSITSRSILETESENKVRPLAFKLDEAPIEIRSYHDWWICEKLLNRRRIVFRVIGHSAVGMGHISRCLALAHEISDHEVYFVCDTESFIATTKLAGYDYWLGVYKPEAIEQAIIDLQPDIVVNDMLNTDADYVFRLRDAGIIVVNLEDLGSGASVADLTINDLYDDPLLSGESILWGHNWFFLRDEFQDALPNTFQKRVNRLLITFGGTDPSDFTRNVLPLVAPYCAEQGIAIDVVSGDGYSYKEELQSLIAGLDADVTYTHITGVISRIMENAQLAISSNGRTVYELAHMNIPAIVLSHHERERTHLFACEKNGFLPLNIANGPEHDSQILLNFQRLVENVDFRHTLFNNMCHHDFLQNKHKVVAQIQNLLHRVL